MHVHIHHKPNNFFNKNWRKIASCVQTRQDVKFNAARRQEAAVGVGLLKPGTKTFDRNLFSKLASTRSHWTNTDYPRTWKQYRFQTDNRSAKSKQATRKSLRISAAPCIVSRDTRFLLTRCYRRTFRGISVSRTRWHTWVSQQALLDFPLILPYVYWQKIE